MRRNPSAQNAPSRPNTRYTVKQEDSKIYQIPRLLLLGIYTIHISKIPLLVERLEI